MSAQHTFCRYLLKEVLVDSKETLPNLKPSDLDITKSSLAKAEAIEHLMDQQTELDDDLRAAIED